MRHDDKRNRILAHRGVWASLEGQNSLPALTEALDAGFGVETDLRATTGEIVLSHDSIAVDVSCRLEALLEDAERRPSQMLALNVKEDGLLPLLSSFRREQLGTSYFFFDMSFPEMLKYVRFGLTVAVRVSEFEPLNPQLFKQLERLPIPNRLRYRSGSVLQVLAEGPR